MTHSVDDFHERLEGLAKAATPGEWGVEDPMDHCLTIVSNPADPVYDWKWIATCDWPDEDEHLVTSREVKANAAYIAADNPPTILKLIAENRAYREALEDAVSDREFLVQVIEQAASVSTDGSGARGILETGLKNARIAEGSALTQGAAT